MDRCACGPGHCRRNNSSVQKRLDFTINTSYSTAFLNKAIVLTGSMPSGMRWTIGRPSFQIAANQFRRGSSWRFSTKSGVGGHSIATQRTTKVPGLTNRMRRLARAHPEAIASVSPAAAEESRAKFPAASSLDEDKHQEEPGEWRKADFGTPEFFEWLNTMPADVEGRVGEEEEEALAVRGRTRSANHAHAEDDDEDEDGHNPDAELNGKSSFGKTFLVPRAKMSSYDLDIYASGLLKAREKVLLARTQAQLRLAHDRLRETEATLYAKAGNYNRVGVGFEESAPSAGQAAKVNESNNKEQQPRSRRVAVRSTRVLYGPSETFAYIFHRMIPAYTVVHRVMTELKNELPDLNPRSMLDFGSGPGTAALAVWDVWGREGDEIVDENGNETWEGSRLSEVRLVEESQSMKDACKVMLEHVTQDGRVRVGYGSSLLEEARAAGRADGEGTPGGKKFDLVVAAYSLSDLSTHESRAAATAVLWSLVAPGGALVVVENGSAKGSHTVRSARKMILRPTSLLSLEDMPHPTEEEEKVHEGSDPKTRVPYVVGPCRHDKECPLQPGEFCRFSQKVPWNAVHVDKSSVKSLPFSYVSIRKGPPAPQTKEFDDGVDARTTSSSVDLLKEFTRQRANGGGLSDAMESLGTDGIWDGSLRREEWARLIRKPLKAKGHALLDVCSPDGSIQRKIVSKGKWKAVPGVFVAARKSELGGLWPYLDDHDARDRTALRSIDEDQYDGGDNSDSRHRKEQFDEDDEWDPEEGWEEDGGQEWESDDEYGALGGRRSRMEGKRGRRRDRSSEEAVYEEGW